MSSKVYHSVNSLNSGEVSELISGMREEISKYASACIQLENSMPLVEGGCKKFPGTYFGGPCLGKSRLAPFQFSTDQGAILELSERVIRIWEPTNGAFGLVIGFTGAVFDYDPTASYAIGDTVLVGSFAQFIFADLSSLTIAAPYGGTNAGTIAVTVTVNTVDALAVTATGSSPNQGINIALANTTNVLNGTSFIQTAIRALLSLNSPSNNYVDLSGWTVTPGPTYLPPITAPITSYPMTVVNLPATALQANTTYYYPYRIVLGNPIVAGPQWGPSTAASAVIELVTPYMEADLFDLDCSTQSADVLWIFHPDYPPACVERLSSNAWQYSLSPPGGGPGEPPYRGTLGMVKTGFSALGQVITAITKASPCVVTISNVFGVFSDGDRIYINLCAGMVELNEGEFIVQNSSFDGNGNETFNIANPDTGALIDSAGFIAYTGGGFAVQVVPMFAKSGDYPACGTLYQERLCVGGSLNHPTQMNGSTQGDYSEFICDPNEDDHAIQFTLVSNKLDQILNMIGTPNALILGTAGGVWTMAGVNGESLTQVSVTAAKQSTWGVSAIQPQMIGDHALFVSRSARIVMVLIFNFVSNQWDNLDLTRLNRSITLGPTKATSGIVQTAMQIEPYPIFWAVRADGQLLGLVFNQQDQIAAWFRVNMLPGGGAVESAAVITSQNEEDQLAVVVRRTINGVTVRYFEYFMPQELFGQLSNAFFVHSGQQWQGSGPFAIIGISNGNQAVVSAPGHNFQNGQSVQISGVSGMVDPSNQQSINQDKTEAYIVDNSNPGAGTFELAGMDTTAWSAYVSRGTVMQVSNQVTGMTYLMGEEVVAVGDGALILEPTPVISDIVTFDYYANLITIGLPYTVTIQPVNPVLTSPASTTRGMKQTLSRATLSLYQAMGGKFGTDSSHLYDITYGPGTKGKLPQMWTGELTRDLDSDWSDASTFLITQSDPLPFTLRGLVMRLSYNPD